MALQQAVETFTPDNLFAAVQLMPVIPGEITVASGEGKLTRGALLTSAGKHATKGASSTDEVYAVLAEDVDATSAAVTAPVYFTGEFNEAALNFKAGNSGTLEDFRVSARKVGIFFRKNI